MDRQPRHIGSTRDDQEHRVLDDVTRLPAGNMRLLEGAMALAAIVTAILIGAR
jgi:hypothetical protein